MVTRKSSRLEEEKVSAWQVGNFNTFTEVRYASYPFALLESWRSFGAQFNSRRHKLSANWRWSDTATNRHPGRCRARRHKLSPDWRWTDTAWKPRVILSCVLLIVLVGCNVSDSRSPQSAWNDLYASGRTLLERGDHLVAAQEKAEQGIRESQGHDPVWNWKFRILKAEVLIWRGNAAGVLPLLSDGPPTPLSKGEFAVRAKLTQGLAYTSLRKNAEANRSFGEAEKLASETAPFMLGQVALARGILSDNEESYAKAEEQDLTALKLARQEGNHFIETSALSNLGQVSTHTNHFDEAIERFIECKRLAQASGYVYQEHISLSNLGWSYLELGDLPKAVSSFSQEEKIIESFEPLLREQVFDSLGEAYLAQENYSDSKKYYTKAYDVAEEMQRAGSSDQKFFIAHVLDALAEVALEEGSRDEAEKYNQLVVALHEDVPAFDLTSARIGIAKREFEKAGALLDRIIGDKRAQISVRWQAEAELANLYVAQNDTRRAEQQFQKTIVSFENTRIPLSNEEHKMAFFQKATRVYDQYISFLMAEQKPFEAFQVAESNRAHALAEGLGLKNPAAARLSNIQSFLGQHHYVVLAYWLGKESSVAWVIAPKGFQFFTLPARRDVAKQVDQYNHELQHSGEDGSELGQKLYTMLVEPAERFIPKESHIALIPAGNLSQLNFETLVAPGPPPHYWIDDVELENASSLPLFMRAVAGESGHSTNLLLDKLLMLGAPAKASDEYPPPGHAGEEIKLIQEHFLPASRTVITDKEATPSAYRDSHPKQFGVIHFATHGTASEISPLDSAIILAPDAEDTSHKYKLYAREIIREPLRAELVTISACSGAGVRTYSGEGLVGLAWSFLRAGAHHVIAGLWDVDDAAAPELMDRFYSELGNRRSPSAALRSAKLRMLHSNTVRRDPYYWASLQLYTGS
jgi:CHAT domain-containing protein